MLRDIKDLFEYEEEENYYKHLRVSNFLEQQLYRIRK